MVDEGSYAEEGGLRRLSKNKKLSMYMCNHKTNTVFAYGVTEVDIVLGVVVHGPSGRIIIRVIGKRPVMTEKRITISIHLFPPMK